MATQWPFLSRAIGGLLGGAVLLLSAGTTFAKPLDVEPEDLRPGLVAIYNSPVDKAASLSRIDSRPAFTLGHSSIHPRIPPGPFEARWSGVILVNDAGPIRFEAFLCGEATVEIDGVMVLTGRGERETALVRGKEGLARPAGLYRVDIHYQSLVDLPARLQLWWKGPEFAREPIPAWHFKHLITDAPAAVKDEQLAEAGRKAVERHGCARCHSQAFPGVTAPPPGPSLADIGRRVKRDWLLDWLADPAKVRPDSHMPALFAPDRMGFLERWVIADMLLADGNHADKSKESTGDHRMGRRRFVDLGCATCHMLPDDDKAARPDPERTAFVNLADRWPAAALAAFLANPSAHYPDGRMPRLPLTPQNARDIAAYLLLWSKSREKLGWEGEAGEAPAEPSGIPGSRSF